MVKAGGSVMRQIHSLVCTGSDKSGFITWLLQFSGVEKISLMYGKGPGVWDLPTGEVQEVGKQIWRDYLHQC